MKLSLLYSNNKKFMSIDFNDGVNIIIGRINNPENMKANVHNLGKSVIVRLIDYMLLKDTSKGGYFNDKTFEGYCFFLEIKLNDGSYATIKRETKSNLVSIKKHIYAKQNYINENEWDYDNYKVTGKKRNAQDVLQALLKFNVLSDMKYRNSLTYFLRGQNDYNDPFQLSKYGKGRDSVWKPMLFELLGYNGKLLNDIYSLNDKLEEEENNIKAIKKQFSVKENELDKYLGIKNVIQEKIDTLNDAADNFNFYLHEANISSDLVDDIEKEIAKLNIQVYTLKNEIESINDSLDCETDFDYNDVYELYNEMKIYFPDYLKKTYDELNDFNIKITKERHDKLSELLSSKSTLLHTDEIKLQNLNERRVSLLSQLSELDSFNKFKNSQKEIVELKTNLLDIENKIESVKKINEAKIEIDDNKQLVDKYKTELHILIETSTEKGKQIKKNFSEFVKYIINTDAVLTLIPNSTGNINFGYVFLDGKGIPTKEDKGHTYMKEICACMDLAIVKSYINESYYRFTFHDGFLDGDDPKFAIAYLNLISNLAKDGLQCIVTMIDSVVPKKADGSTYELNKNDIILELNDNQDGSGKLFGFNY